MHQALLLKQNVAQISPLPMASSASSAEAESQKRSRCGNSAAAQPFSSLYPYSFSLTFVRYELWPLTARLRRLLRKAESLHQLMAGEPRHPCKVAQTRPKQL